MHLKPCATVSVIISPVIKGGQMNNPFNDSSYAMENVMVYNQKSSGGLKPKGTADVEVINHRRTIA